jgi:hypothetical protein
MVALRRQIGAAIEAFMADVERRGGDYAIAAIEVVQTLAEEQAVLFGCIGQRQWRKGCVRELMRRMPDAVEEAHRRAVERGETMRVVQ